MMNDKGDIRRILFIAATTFGLLTAPHTVSALAEQLSGTDPVTESGSPPQEQGAAYQKQGQIKERGLQRALLLGVPPTASAPLQLVGPTENLTKIINALSHKHKSLTTVITTASALQLTQPVEISILFTSPWGTNTRLTQPYQQKFGNRFVYNDPEGDGTLRHLRMDLWLTEPKPGGGHYSYSMTWQADLDPLYDVTISPLVFTLQTSCDIDGVNEIRLGWNAPDTQRQEDYQRYSFGTKKGWVQHINRFAWSKTEVSASQNLHMPSLRWDEHDPYVPNPFDLSFPGRFDSQAPISKINLIPGKTQGYAPGLFPGQSFPGPEQIRGNSCWARIQYTITYALRLYPNL